MDRPANERLSEYWQSAGPYVCWYPSAGNCYRDLLLWNWEAVTRHVTLRPSIFIHTDYNHNWNAVKTGVVHRDGRTSVEVLDVHHLAFKDVGLRYFVDRRYVDFPEDSLRQPAADLPDVRLTSKVIGTIESVVLYFYWENINFLQEILLARKLPVSHFFKLREGCGFGGNRKSISVAYGFLGQMGCRYLLADEEIHFDQRLLESLYGDEDPEAFSLDEIAQVGWLSGFEMTLFEVDSAPGSCHSEMLAHALQKIGRSTRRGRKQAKPSPVD